MPLKFDLLATFSLEFDFDDLIFLFLRLFKHFLVSDLTGGALSFMSGMSIDFACRADVLVIESVTDHG